MYILNPTRAYPHQQICISPAPRRSSKLTHTGVEIDICAFQTGFQLSSAATGMSLELRFFDAISVAWSVHVCWTTGSWRSCLSLEVVSSIPAGSTIIYRFLCGFTCVSLCESIKIKPTNIWLWVDILRLRQNGRHSTDDIFKYISLYENGCIFILKKSLKCAPNGPTHNKTTCWLIALVQIMACVIQATSQYLSQWWPILLTHTVKPLI